MQRPRDNARFRRTEYKILHSTRLILDQDFHRNVRVAEICRRSSIEQSTFYRHYHCFEEFLIELGRRMETELYNILCAKVRETDKTYMQVLFFIYQKREAFRVIVRQDLEMIGSILGPVRGVLTRRWSNYDEKRIDYLYKIHIAEILAEIKIWIKEENFDPIHIERHVKNLTYLNETVCRRLSGVLIE